MIVNTLSTHELVIFQRNRLCSVLGGCLPRTTLPTIVPRCHHLPVYRTRMECAYAKPDPPKIKKARATPVNLSPEEKEEKKNMAKARTAVREKQK